MTLSYVVLFTFLDNSVSEESLLPKRTEIQGLNIFTMAPTYGKAVP